MVTVNISVQSTYCWSYNISWRTLVLLTMV